MEFFNKLRADFPKEAYSIDSSRGFNLTSLKAQYIKERLNEVFSIWCWNFEEKFQDIGNGVMCFGKLYVSYTNKEKEKVDREVTACGFSEKKRNMGDTYKGASTDALSKAASFIGIGNEVFKGNINLNTVIEKKKGTAVGTNSQTYHDAVLPKKFEIYGVCPNCQSFLNKSPKTGKIYCSNWKVCDFKPYEDKEAQPLPESLKSKSVEEIDAYFKKPKAGISINTQDIPF